jgi:hypothetical protein
MKSKMFLIFSFDDIAETEGLVSGAASGLPGVHSSRQSSRNARQTIGVDVGTLTLGIYLIFQGIRIRFNCPWGFEAALDIRQLPIRR